MAWDNLGRPIRGTVLVVKRVVMRIIEMRSVLLK